MFSLVLCCVLPCALSCRAFSNLVSTPLFFSSHFFPCFSCLKLFLSRLILSQLVLPRLALPCRVSSWRAVLPCLFSYLLLSFSLFSALLLSLVSFRLVLSCLVLACSGISCVVLSRLVSSFTTTGSSNLASQKQITAQRKQKAQQKEANYCTVRTKL